MYSMLLFSTSRPQYDNKLYGGHGNGHGAKENTSPNAGGKSYCRTIGVAFLLLNVVLVWTRVGCSHWPTPMASIAVNFNN